MTRLFVPGLIAAFLLVFAAGCSKPAATPVSAAESQKKIVVPVARAVVRTVPAGFDATGAFAADESSDVAPLVSGRVVATPVDAGAFVHQGDVICELDHRDAQLRLDQVKAQFAEATAALTQTQWRIGHAGAGAFDPNNVPEVAAAKANYESAEAQAKMAAADAKRFENLVGTGDVSRSAFEKVRTQQETAQAQANAARKQYEAALNGARQGWFAVETSQASLSAAKAQLAQAEKALTDTSIRAPFDGYVTSRPVAVGQYVALTPPTKIANIVKIGVLKLQLQTPEQRAAQVKTGMTVNARVVAWPDRVFTGKVTAVNPSVDPGSRVFIVEARFDNARNELRPGMFATAKVMLPGGENGVFVPVPSVARDKTTDSFQVFVVENGIARLKVVVPGEQEGGQIRVVSGLSGSETVATARINELYDGAAVEVKP
jgi:multidrug efflux pump subunit AcrA (membrane-fusion protein)